MRFLLLHIITTQQGTFLQGLAYPSSNLLKPTPLGILRYLHKLRAKSQDMDKWERNKGGAGDGEGAREI